MTCLRTVFAIALLAVTAGAESDNVDWLYHGGDAANTKFSPLDEINADNLEDLRIVWRWQSPDVEVAGPEIAGDQHNRATPIVIDGVIYFSTSLNLVVAIDAATGVEKWRFDPGAWEEEAFLFGFHRGASYWQGAEGEARILFGTFTGYLYSLDAYTGKVDSAFGDGGRVDLTKGLGRDVDHFSYSSLQPPLISHDVVIPGSAIIDWWAGRPLPALPPPGDVRGFDVRTGELLWTFHTVPGEGEAGAETWEEAGREKYGAANVWSMMSADHELGYVYLPVATISSDYYGGGRPGDNLYGDGILCLDARTGKRVWHYQFIHHGLFDYDTPAAPVLVDVVVDGKPVKAVAQVTKQGFCYVFDRVTGKPVWPIEERPAPASTAPGEHASPTQPFPTKPAAFDRQGLSEEDLIDFTPELRQAAKDIIADYDYGPLYTPPSERGTIMLPGIMGAANYPGAAADPRTGLLYVPSSTNQSLLKLQKATASEGPYEYIGNVRPFLRGPERLPLTKPPYGRITAIDLNTGEHVWMQVEGRGPVNHPALRELELDDLGWSRLVFATVTPNFLLSVARHPPRGGDYYVDPRAYLTARDLATGEELGRVPLPGNGFGNPMTFRAGGRQQIVVPMSNSELVALAVPMAGENLPQQVVDRDDADHTQFYAAVEAIDRGQLGDLKEMLEAEPALLTARGYLDEEYEHGFFRGATLLHHVAGSPIRTELPANIVDIARLLLVSGADAQAQTLDSAGAFGLVARADQPRWRGVKMDLLRLLAEAGADPNEGVGEILFNALIDANDRELPAALHEMGGRLDLRFAAGLGLVEQMRGFIAADGALRSGASSDYRPLRNGAAEDPDVLAEALGFAAVNGRLQAAQFLLDHGADPNRYTPGFLWPSDQGATALHRAVYGNQPDIVRLLLNHGADTSLKDKNWDSAPGQWVRYFSQNAELTELLDGESDDTTHQ